MPIKARAETLAMMTEDDKKALMAIYRHRCLNEPLLRKYFYGGETTGYTLARLREFNSHGLLDIVEYEAGEYPAIFLSARGIQTLRELYQIPVFTVNEETGKRRREIQRAADLKMPEILLNHQMHLSEFALAIEKEIAGMVSYEYQDNKFIDSCTYAQPDGIFILPNCDLFLEMDMAHERMTELCKKWAHYRNYLAAKEHYLSRPKKIVVLFATENLKLGGLVTRRKSVLKSLGKTIFDLFGEDFECYIGPSSELVRVAVNVALSRDSKLPTFLPELGFRLSYPQSVQELCGEPYLYMRRLDNEGKVNVQDGRLQHFFLEDYTAGAVSVLTRAASFPATASLLWPKLRKEIPLLVLVPDEKTILRDLSAIDSLGVPHVYFTTEQRLKERSLPEALFSIDQLGRFHHFNDYALKGEVFEKIR